MTAVAPTFPLTARFRLCLHLVALLAIGAYCCMTDSLDPLILGAVSLGISWLLLEILWSGPPPARASTTGIRALLDQVARMIPTFIANVTVLLAALRLAQHVYQYLYGSQSLIVGLAGFISVLTVCKFFEPRNLRNAAQILVLSLLLVVSATMFSGSSLFYSLILAAYFVLLTYALVLLNLSGETDRHKRDTQEAGGGAGAGETAARDGGPRRRAGLFRRDLASVVKQCVLLLLPVAVVVFLLVPRTRTTPLLGSNWGMGIIQSGFSDTVQFRDYGQLSLSDAPVMRVQMFRDGENVSAEFGDLYFRGEVLNDYDPIRATWSHGPYPSKSGPSAMETRWASDTDPVLVRYTILIPGHNLFLLSPSAPIQEATGRLIFSPGDMTLQDSMSASRSVKGTFSYSATWDPNLPFVASVGRVTPGVLGPPPQVPRILGTQPDTRAVIAALSEPVMVDKRVATLARDLIQSGMGADAPGPDDTLTGDQIHQVVGILENYLRTNYRYSLTFRQSDKTLDPPTDFLLNRGIKKDDTGGHCEFFASAMVMLCRSVGLNARMVTGYHGGEFDPVTGEYLIRQKHAHAWAEVYVPHEGWLRSDPSPIGSNIDTKAGSGSLLTDLTQLAQSMWAAVVVNFDNDSRAAVGRWFSRWLGALWSGPGWKTTGVAGALALAGVILFRWRRRARRHQSSPESASGLPHRFARVSSQVTFLEELLAPFERTSPRRADQTPLEFLQPRLSGLAAPAAAEARWLIQTAYGVRFGGRKLDAELRQQVARALKNVKNALHTRSDGH